jgi:hypothetical protein
MFGKGDKKGRPFWSVYQGDKAPEYTTEEKEAMRHEERMFLDSPMGDLTNWVNVREWATAVRRPGESCAEDSYMIKNRLECEFIARCVTIALAVEADRPRIAWQAMQSREARKTAGDVVHSMGWLIAEMQKEIARYDAARPAGVSGGDVEAMGPDKND